MNKAVTINPLRRVTILVLIVAFCVGAGVAIFELVGQREFDDTAWQVVATAFTFAVYSLCMLAAFRLESRRPPFAKLARCEVALFVVGLVFTVVAIWINADTDWVWQGAGALFALTLFGAHASLFLALDLPRGDRAAAFVRLATVVVGEALGALIAIDFIANDSGDVIDDRVLGVVAVLFLLGNVTLPLVRLLSPVTSE